MKKYWLHILLLVAFAILLAIFSVLAFLLPGNEPQDIVDSWSLAHFAAGFIFGYFSVSLLNINISSKTHYIKISIAIALGIQVAWKIYEYVYGTNIFLASLPNVVMDLSLGFVASIIGALFFSKIIVGSQNGKK